MELEGTGRRDAEMLDDSKYPQLNINGAIIVRKNQVFILIILGEGVAGGLQSPQLERNPVLSDNFFERTIGNLLTALLIS